MIVYLTENKPGLRNRTNATDTNTYTKKSDPS